MMVMTIIMITTGARQGEDDRTQGVEGKSTQKGLLVFSSN
jgi:hypothetical protein